MPSKAAIEFAEKYFDHMDIKTDAGRQMIQTLAGRFDAFIRPVIDVQACDMDENIWCYEQARKKRTLTAGEDADIKEYRQWLDYWTVKDDSAG